MLIRYRNEYVSKTVGYISLKLKREAWMTVGIDTMVKIMILIATSRYLSVY